MIEGELSVRLAWDGQRVRSTTIRSSRPFVARRLLANRAAADAVALVPALFSVCAHAQGAAAAIAVDAALGRTNAPSRMTAREAAVAIEAMQEHLTRVLVDWPDVLGCAKETGGAAAARRRIAPVLAQAHAGVADPAAWRALAADVERVATEYVYAMPPQQWIALPDLDALGDWIACGACLGARLLAALAADTPRFGASDVALLPRASVDAIAAAIGPELVRDPAFALAPCWHDAPVETSALARQRDRRLVAALAAREGHSTAARLVARLVELAVLLARLRGDVPLADTPLAQAIAVGAGEGIAAVETARGLLVHRVRLAGDRVADWDIVAPTEWNFHPRGAAARALEALAADDRAALARRARIAVAALDPCVACRIEVDDA